MEQTVFIVDSDPQARDSLGLLFSAHNLRSSIFSDAESFLNTWSPDRAGCLLADTHLSGIGGLELHNQLSSLTARLPTIFMSAHGSVSLARQAFRAGAIDFLEKPVDQIELLASISEIMARQETSQLVAARDAGKKSLLNRLTPREREVMELVVEGRHNRAIAETLGISSRTVEVHKTRTMTKLEVDNLPDLVRLSLEAAGTDLKRVAPEIGNSL